jgi:hypothetical protein
MEPSEPNTIQTTPAIFSARDQPVSPAILRGPSLRIVNAIAEENHDAERKPIKQPLPGKPRQVEPCLSALSIFV